MPGRGAGAQPGVYFGDGPAARFRHKGPHDIRIATLNSFGFRRLGPTPVTAYGIATVMKREQVDVALSPRSFPRTARFRPTASPGFSPRGCPTTSPKAGRPS
ncbi:MAG: hypothetical protein ACLUYV_05195 [Alistipes shahii]